jgi:pimeloyl-ACP methyl ester carboxylesterase
VTRAVAAGIATLVLALPATAHGAGEPLPPQGAPPPGANDFSCKPPKRHPFPVVLVHGTFLNMAVSWNALAPDLERLGYCVFALDYGNNGRGDIPTSAGQLETFVDRVLKRTGARKVSLVGHSQGGMMPRYLIKFLGHAKRVDDLVGLSPSNHGTTNPLAGPAGQFGCTACAQQKAGSAFLKKLNAGDQTPPPVDYTVVETNHDEVVTPYTSEFLPKTRDGRVTNVLIQDRCPSDPVDHINITNDGVALQWALNALGRPGPANPKYQPDCTGARASTFPDSSSVGARRAKRHARIRLGGVRRHGERLRIALAARGGKVSGVRVVVRTRSGRLVARSRRLASVGAHRRTVAPRLRRRVHRGRRYVLSAHGRSGGHQVSARRAFRLR